MKKSLFISVVLLLSWGGAWASVGVRFVAVEVPKAKRWEYFQAVGFGPQGQIAGSFDIGDGIWEGFAAKYDGASCVSMVAEQFHRVGPWSFFHPKLFAGNDIVATASYDPGGQGNLASLNSSQQSVIFRKRSTGHVVKLVADPASQTATVQGVSPSGHLLGGAIDGKPVVWQKQGESYLEKKLSSLSSFSKVSQANSRVFSGGVQAVADQVFAVGRYFHASESVLFGWSPGDGVHEIPTLGYGGSFADINNNLWAVGRVNGPPGKLVSESGLFDAMLKGQDPGLTGREDGVPLSPGRPQAMLWIVEDSTQPFLPDANEFQNRMINLEELICSQLGINRKDVSLSEALYVNDRNEIIVSLVGRGFSKYVFVASKGERGSRFEATELGALVEAPKAFRVTRIVGIDNDGDILVNGKIQSPRTKAYPFLLRRKLEP